MAKIQPQSVGLEPELPRHIGIIMDGNGRYATRRGLPRKLGHRAGMERLRGLIRFSSDIGIEVLSLYAFSTENWKRPKEEIGALFDLFLEYFISELDELDKNNVCIRIMGDMSAFPEKMGQETDEAMYKTRNNTGLKLNIALNYGSRDEMVRGIRKLAQDAIDGKIRPEDITEQSFGNYLDTAGIPDPDLMIRTSGELRLSNFLLWQMAYTEFYFTDVAWPDFNKAELVKAIEKYNQRDRRYGGVKEE